MRFFPVFSTELQTHEHTAGIDADFLCGGVKYALFPVFSTELQTHTAGIDADCGIVDSGRYALRLMSPGYIGSLSSSFFFPVVA